MQAHFAMGSYVFAKSKAASHVIDAIRGSFYLTCPSLAIYVITTEQNRCHKSHQVHIEDSAVHDQDSRTCHSRWDTKVLGSDNETIM